nr:ribosome biogenesis NEP1-like protein [Ipomoea batatas]
MQKQWRSLMNAGVTAAAVGGGKRQFASSAASQHNKPKSWYSSGDAIPIWLLAGFTTAALGMAVHTAKNQLIHAPSVSVKKSTRENLTEVDDPQTAVNGADKFVNKSFLRKVSRIQDPETRVLQDPTRPDPFTIPRKYESLESAGVHK